MLNRKSLLYAVAVLAFVLIGPGAALAKCATIPQGLITNSAGETIEPGYDSWGYNYQARIFNGDYCGAYRNAAWCQPYVGTNLQMKWNDAWLSNQDCTGDSKLDRHYGYSGYRGSGAWLTNHMWYEYEQNGAVCHVSYFAKIVAAPAVGAYVHDGVWYASGGGVLGNQIWGDFMIVQEVTNDPCGGMSGVSYKAVRPGLGNWENPNVVQ